MDSYTCPYCNQVHTTAQWNTATAIICNGGQEPIPLPLPHGFRDDETLYHCPSCRLKVYGDEISIYYDGEADSGSEIRVRMGR
jgi:hypothetical protein